MLASTVHRLLFDSHWIFGVVDRERVSCSCASRSPVLSSTTALGLSLKG
jgi:hypothetical protein